MDLEFSKKKVKLLFHEESSVNFCVALFSYVENCVKDERIFLKRRGRAFSLHHPLHHPALPLMLLNRLQILMVNNNHCAKSVQMRSF